MSRIYVPDKPIANFNVKPRWPEGIAFRDRDDIIVCSAELDSPSVKSLIIAFAHIEEELVQGSNGPWLVLCGEGTSAEVRNTASLIKQYRRDPKNECVIILPPWRQLQNLAWLQQCNARVRMSVFPYGDDIKDATLSPRELLDYGFDPLLPWKTDHTQLRLPLTYAKSELGKNHGTGRNLAYEVIDFIEEIAGFPYHVYPNPIAK
jgi:hypothetical protein